jgi:hypothetical protein
MVSQCANLECGAPFLYLRHGKLFKIERPGYSARHSRVEYFWLCGNCVRKTTIGSFLDGGISMLHASALVHPPCKNHRKTG